MKPLIFPSIYDKELKRPIKRFRGDVLDIRTGEIYCHVYGSTLEIMRKRKRIVARCLKEALER